MPTIYIVRSGDTLTKIARNHGLADWRTVYYDPENAAFRANRPNPDRICPGDQLVIPNGTGNGPPPPTQPGPPICDFSASGLERVSLSVRPSLVAAPTQPSEAEQGVMSKAFQESRRTLREALTALN